MIHTVSVKTIDATECLLDVQFDGVPFGDKIEMLTVFMEAGKIPHMMISVPFLNLEVDGVNANVDIYDRKREDFVTVDADEIQHVAYDDAQLGREK